MVSINYRSGERYKVDNKIQNDKSSSISNDEYAQKTTNPFDAPKIMPLNTRTSANKLYSGYNSTYIKNFNPSQSDIINSINDKNIRTFLNGIYNFEIYNYQKGENLFSSLLNDPVLGVYAGMNLSVLQNEKAELIVNDRNYDNSIYITQKRATDIITTQEKPDYQQSLNTIMAVLARNGRNPYVWYNMGNIHLQMQEFNKAVDDYTRAIQ